MASVVGKISNPVETEMKAGRGAWKKIFYLPGAGSKVVGPPPFVLQCFPPYKKIRGRILVRPLW